MRAIKIIFFLMGLILIVPLNSFSEGIDTLQNLAKSQNEIQEVLKKETETFKAVKNAFDNGKIKIGQSKNEILVKYGEPVVVLEDSGGMRGAEKWIYKPSSSTYFEGIKIYLNFDENGILSDIEVLE